MAPMVTAARPITTNPCICLLHADELSLPPTPVPESSLRRNAAVVTTPSEKLQIHSALSQVHRDLAELDVALAHLESVKTRLLLKRKAFQTFSDTHYGALSSIRLIPPEILTEIFSYLKPHQHYSPRGDDLLSTHICQQWRQIALSIPHLWSNIRVNVSRGHIKPTLEWVNAWLSRAKGSPLCIDIECCHLYFEDDWKLLLDVVVPHSHRWQHAAITFISGADISRLYKAKDHLPLLETLDISVLESSQSEDGYEADTFEIAPMLKSVSINIERSFESWSIGRLPFTQLEAFNAGFCSVPCAVGLLLIMPNIVSFAAQFREHAYPATTYISPRSLSKLEDLDIEYSIQEELFLNHFNFPCLRHLKYHQSNLQHAGWNPSLISLLQRFSGHLKFFTLLISGERCSQAGLQKLFRFLPKLPHLSIASRRDTNTMLGYSEIIECLTAPSPPNADVYRALPELRRLELDYASGFEAQAFVDMVESRWRSGSAISEVPTIARLKSIKLCCVPSAAVFDSKALDRLKEFAAEGLDINVEIVEGLPLCFDEGICSE